MYNLFTEKYLMLYDIIFPLCMMLAALDKSTSTTARQTKEWPYASICVVDGVIKPLLLAFRTVAQSIIKHCREIIDRYPRGLDVVLLCVLSLMQI